MPRKKSTSTKSKIRVRDQQTFTIALSAYEKAMRLFVKKDWAKARDAFDSFIEEFSNKSDVSEVLDRARAHRASCEDQLASPADDPGTAEEWMLRGVTFANDGEIEPALNALDRADAAGAPAARVHYAKAAALAVAGRHDEALQELEKAIDADPENRAFSLGDPDFERLREMAGYVSLVEPPNVDLSTIEEVARYDHPALSSPEESETLID